MQIRLTLMSSSNVMMGEVRELSGTSQWVSEAALPKGRLWRRYGRVYETLFDCLQEVPDGGQLHPTWDFLEPEEALE